MRPKLELPDLFWMATGAGLLVLTSFVAWHFGSARSADEALALKSRKIALVLGISLDLASASHAEKSAVLGATEQESEAYAQEARAAAARAEAKRDELVGLLSSGGRPPEKELLDEFSKQFEAFRSLNEELLSLAVRHTNAKATALLFGPAAQAIEEMSSALQRVVERSASAHALAALSAYGAETAALHLQTRLAPHIAAASDASMDELEALMNEDDREARKQLERLAAPNDPALAPDVEQAVAAYERFAELRSEILRLSRENTNVLSIAMSLDQMRRAMVLCQDALDALRRAFDDELIPGTDYGPVMPRRLGGPPPDR